MARGRTVRLTVAAGDDALPRRAHALNCSLLRSRTASTRGERGGEGGLVHGGLTAGVTGGRERSHKQQHVISIIRFRFILSVRKKPQFL